MLGFTQNQIRAARFPVAENVMSLHFCLVATVLAVAMPPQADVVNELKAFYLDHRKAPAWQAALKRLTDNDEKQRDDAARYLCALLRQSLQDDLAGEQPWKASPYWADTGIHAPRNLRATIFSALRSSEAGAAAIPVLAWYIEVDNLPSHQETAIEALEPRTEVAAHELRRRIVRTPHPNAAVVLAALGQTDKHKVEIPADELRALCHHYREGVRAAARKLNASRGGKDPGLFDPVNAVQSQPVRRLMDQITPLLIQPIPLQADFVAITTTYRDKDGDILNETVVRGWLLEENDKTVVVFTPFGKRRTFERHEKPVPVKPTSENTITCTVTKLKLETEVKRVAMLRATGDKNGELTERGKRADNRPAIGPSLYEILLGHWLFQTKRYDLAAQILFPVLDAVEFDEFVRATRTGLSAIPAHAMLVAFVGNRDYPEAMRLAKLIKERFKESPFYDDARRLLIQLPRRQEDFQTFKLPTLTEWDELKKKLSRAEQIKYLCQRLRLLNCFQGMRPGSLRLGVSQFAEPCGMADNALQDRYRGKTEVTNPLVALAGAWDASVRRKEEIEGMRLTVADIPLLVPHLRDDWFILAVRSSWPDEPYRELLGTRAIVAEVINDVAKRDLSRLIDFEFMEQDEREKHLEKIIAWTKANAHKSETELLLEGVGDEVREGKPWRDVGYRIRRLVQLKEKKTLPLLLPFLESKTDDARELEEILHCAREFDPIAFKEPARKFLTHESPEVRTEAALIRFQSGDKAGGLTVLAGVLRGDRKQPLPTRKLLELIETLLTEGSEQSREAARQVFRHPNFRELHGFDRVPLVQRFALAKLPDGFRFYLPLLDDMSKTTTTGRSSPRGWPMSSRAR
jgi:hypothetical protein